MSQAKILIVEDNASKEVKVRKALAPLGRETIWMRSITDAFRLVTEQPWELIILDMTFLVDRSAGFDSSRQSMAGVELLQFMARRRLHIPVIVATSHDAFSSAQLGTIEGVAALDDMLRDAFPEVYRATIKVDLSEDEWQTRLLGAARSIIEASAA